MASRNQHTVGLLIDQEYFRTALRQFSMPSVSLDRICEQVAALVAAERKAPVESVNIAQRWSIDSLIDPPRPGDRSEQAKQARNRIETQNQLRQQNCTVEVFPCKVHPGSTTIQGGVDVGLGCRLLWLAGAFPDTSSLKTCMDSVFLIAGDGDFKPALSMALSHRPHLTIFVCARPDTVNRAYREWMLSTDRIKLIPFATLASCLDGKFRVDFSGRHLTSCKDVVAELQSLARRKPSDPQGVWSVAIMLDRNDLSSQDVVYLQRALAPLAAADQAQGHYRVLVTELWLHHNRRLDAACGRALADFIVQQPYLSQLHISHTDIDWPSLQLMLQAAASVNCGPGVLRSAGLNVPADARPSIYMRINETPAATACVENPELLGRFTHWGVNPSTLNLKITHAPFLTKSPPVASPSLVPAPHSPPSPDFSLAAAASASNASHAPATAKHQASANDSVQIQTVNASAFDMFDDFLPVEDDAGSDNDGAFGGAPAGAGLIGNNASWNAYGAENDDNGKAAAGDDGYESHRNNDSGDDTDRGEGGDSEADHEHEPGTAHEQEAADEDQDEQEDDEEEEEGEDEEGEQEGEGEPAEDADADADLAQQMAFLSMAPLDKAKVAASASGSAAKSAKKADRNRLRMARWIDKQQAQQAEKEDHDQAPRSPPSYDFLPPAPAPPQSSGKARTSSSSSSSSRPPLVHVSPAGLPRVALQNAPSELPNHVRVESTSTDDDIQYVCANVVLAPLLGRGQTLMRSGANRSPPPSRGGGAFATPSRTRQNMEPGRATPPPRSSPPQSGKAPRPGASPFPRSPAPAPPQHFTPGSHRGGSHSERGSPRGGRGGSRGGSTRGGRGGRGRS